MTYEEVRQTYSCALPTEQELRDFFANLNMHLAVEDHQGPKGTQKNLVLYFTPFRGKYLNYIRCFNTFHKNKTRHYSAPYIEDDHKPHFQSQFPIYIVLVSDRLNRGKDVPFELSYGYMSTNNSGYCTFAIKRNNRNITDSVYPMRTNVFKQTDSGLEVHSLKHYWPYYILLSETDARRGFCIVSFDLEGKWGANSLFGSDCLIPKHKSLNYLYALMECSLDKLNKNKVFAKSSNKINTDFQLSEREDWYEKQGL